MSRLDELKGLTELLSDKKESEKEGKVLLWILAIIGAIAAIAAIAYGVYRYMNPEYLEDFEDEFEDDDEDLMDDEDIFEDEGEK